ncbi:MAG TPA: anti-sigma factor [Chryseosolibacter sp.]
MNLTEYISSGILEAYALGELSEKESAEVERYLATYPELKAELARIEQAQENFLMHAAIKPSFSVKSQLMDKIADQYDTEDARVVSLQPEKQTSLWKLAVAASISIAVVASYLAFTYYSKWQRSESSLAALIAQNEQIARDYSQVNERIDRLENDLQVMDNPKFQRVIMSGTPNAPDAMASVYWNESTQEVYLSIQNMKELAREKQYQLWAIIDGKPVDAGVFDGQFAGLHKMKDVNKGAVLFAVTVEPRGGKPSPTMETMQVKGEVKKG